MFPSVSFLDTDMMNANSSLRCIRAALPRMLWWLASSRCTRCVPRQVRPSSQCPAVIHVEYKPCQHDDVGGISRAPLCLSWR